MSYFKLVTLLLLCTLCNYVFKDVIKDKVIAHSNSKETKDILMLDLDHNFILYRNEFFLLINIISF